MYEFMYEHMYVSAYVNIEFSMRICMYTYMCYLTREKNPNGILVQRNCYLLKLHCYLTLKY